MKKRVSVVFFALILLLLVGCTTQGEAPALTIESQTATSITVTSVEGAEYSKDNGVTWQDSNVFSDLMPGNTYKVTIRYKQTAEKPVSKSATSLSVTLDKADQTALTIAAVNDKKYGDQPFALTTSGGSGSGNVTFTVVSGPGTISGNMLTITGAGNIVVKATKAANENYNAATSAEITIVVAKADQSALTISQVTGKKYGDEPFKLTTTGGTGTGAVTYTVVSGNATVEGDMLTITGIGDVVLTANKAADSNYNAVSSAETTVSIAKGDLNLSFADIEDKKYGDQPFRLEVVGYEDSQDLTFTVVSGNATIEGDMLTITGAGDIVVEVTKAEDELYNEATAEITISVAKAEQTGFTLTPIANKTYGVQPFELTTSGGVLEEEVIFEVVSGNATIENNILTITGAGEVEIKATLIGDENYHEITSTAIFTVEQATPAVEVNFSGVLFAGGTLPALEDLLTTNLQGIEGEFAITSQPETLEVGDHEIEWTFTPASEHYKTITSTTTIKVVAAEIAVIKADVIDELSENNAAIFRQYNEFTAVNEAFYTPVLYVNEEITTFTLNGTAFDANTLTRISMGNGKYAEVNVYKVEGGILYLSTVAINVEALNGTLLVGVNGEEYTLTTIQSPTTLEISQVSAALGAQVTDLADNTTSFYSTSDNGRLNIHLSEESGLTDKTMVFTKKVVDGVVSYGVTLLDQPNTLWYYVFGWGTITVPKTSVIQYTVAASGLGSVTLTINAKYETTQVIKTDIADELIASNEILFSLYNNFVEGSEEEIEAFYTPVMYVAGDITKITLNNTEFAKNTIAKISMGQGKYANVNIFRVENSILYVSTVAINIEAFEGVLKIKLNDVDTEYSITVLQSPDKLNISGVSGISATASLTDDTITYASESNIGMLKIYFDAEHDFDLMTKMFTKKVIDGQTSYGITLLNDEKNSLWYYVFGYGIQNETTTRTIEYTLAASGIGNAKLIINAEYTQPQGK